MGEVDDAVGSAADHALVQRGMSGGADDEQVGLDLARKLDDGAHGMSGKEMDLKAQPLTLGHAAGALNHGMKPPCRDSAGFANLLDELRHRRNFLHRDG